MKSSEIRKKYLEFFKNKGHKVVLSASLIPENDPTTLFTGSGMQPMVPYLLGEKYPGGEKRVANSQKCFRSGDIEEVGDNRHTTFFEMLGNWSLGDYFKKEQIEWMFEFLTKELRLDPNRIYVSVYRGNEKFNLPKEEASVKIWQEQFEKVGIKAETVDLIELRQHEAREEVVPRGGMKRNEVERSDGRGATSRSADKINDLASRYKIFYYPDSENWWSRAGEPNKMPEGEIGGPDSEMFWDFGPELKLHENSEWKDQPCHPACDCGRFVEFGNNVFMQYKKVADGFEELENKNIDFGGGLERLTMVVNDTPDIFLIDLFKMAREKIEELSNKKYGGDNEVTKAMRVILDHLRGAMFLINDGANPFNKDQGYFTRRLIRRAVRFGHQLGIEENFTKEITKTFIETYGDYYTDLKENEERICQVIEEEERKFRKTLIKGLKIIEKMFPINCKELEGDEYPPIVDLDVDPEIVFDLYQTHGFPFEMIQEELTKRDLRAYEPEFKRRLQQHKDLSRTASAGKFKGGLADSGEETKKLHTTAHLMLSALRKVLGDDVHQKGSNITAERLRFDFSYGEKLTDEQKVKVEKLVNEAIEKKLPVTFEEMSVEDARKKGAEGVFDSKYGDKVKVYSIGDFSKEICGGPHVKNTDELGVFKIKKEKSSGAGVRRIKAIIE